MIAEGNHKLGKIAGAMGIETSGLTPYLSTLGDLGFIVKDTPVTEKIRRSPAKGFTSYKITLCASGSGMSTRIRENWNWITPGSSWTRSKKILNKSL